jgi:preprotein translocase subunit YajC
MTTRNRRELRPGDTVVRPNGLLGVVVYVHEGVATVATAGKHNRFPVETLRRY